MVRPATINPSIVESKRALLRFYDLKKKAESIYFQYCIKEGRLPAPDIVYYHWDKRRITRALQNEIQSNN